MKEETVARYVGDLTDPKNGEQRDRAVKVLFAVVDDVRERRVTKLSVDYKREPAGFGVPPWSAGVEVEVKRGRHEK